MATTRILFSTFERVAVDDHCGIARVGRIRKTKIVAGYTGNMLS